MNGGRKPPLFYGADRCIVMSQVKKCFHLFFGRGYERKLSNVVAMYGGKE
jgi:hypothetical protein